MKTAQEIINILKEEGIPTSYIINQEYWGIKNEYFRRNNPAKQASETITQLRETIQTLRDQGINAGIRELEAKIDELGGSVDPILNDRDSDDWEWIKVYFKSIGIGEIEVLNIPSASVEEVVKVFFFKSHGVHLKINGWVNSYDTGSVDYNGWQHAKEVFPKKVTTIVYEENK